ncbi:hypothetical protein Patl1_24121 [Pistacia atlantica]|uniref:Uncharacterized protein n=1 Tax=Pistacia atlantica TaxID=434234 RepID=A0ACC0ZUW3_9ROSI|nr:hypothetical protein Patl1_24121 [Pistacia atlantica]
MGKEEDKREMRAMLLGWLEGDMEQGSSVPEAVVLAIDIPPPQKDKSQSTEAGLSSVDKDTKLIEWLPSLVLLIDRNRDKDKLRLDLFNAALDGNIDVVSSQFNNPLFSNLARELLEDEDANENELAMTEYEHGMDRLTPLHRLALTPFHLLDQNNRSKESDVEKLVMPSYKELKNTEGKTPRELFTSTHAGLLKDGEKWMRSIASQCMLVAAIIALMVFQAAFPVPGSNSDNEGRNIEFRIFAMADVIALSSSSISILMFLSIITSRYVENDFLVSLPLKLVVGLLTLFISIGTMMLAFISSFYTAYDHPRSNAILILGIIFVSLPLFAFDSSQYSLLRDILYSFCFRFFS